MFKVDLNNLKISTIASITTVIVTVVILLIKTPFWNYLNLILTPIISAFVIAYALDYMVRGFEKKLKMSRGFGILFSVIVFIGIFILLGLFIIPSAYDAITSLVKSIYSLNIDFDQILNLRFENPTLESLRIGILNQIEPTLLKFANSFASYAVNMISEVRKLISALVSAFVIFSIAIYMLIEKKDLIARIKRLIYAYFSEKTQRRIFSIASLSDQLFRDFVIGKVIDSIIIGFITYFILVILKFQYAVLIALLVGITNVIPYFGPFIGAVPAAAITFVANINDPIQVLYILIIIFVIQQLDGLVIGPMILGDSIGVSAFWIITSVTLGGSVAGIVGMFIGVPFVVLIKQILEEDVENNLKKKGLENTELSNLRMKKK